MASDLSKRRKQIPFAVHNENRRKDSMIDRLYNLSEQMFLTAELVVNRLSRDIGSRGDRLEACAVAIAQENRLRSIQYQFAYPLGLAHCAVLARAPTIVARDRDTRPAAGSSNIESRCDLPIDRRHPLRGVI